MFVEPQLSPSPSVSARAPASPPALRVHPAPARTDAVGDAFYSATPPAQLPMAQVRTRHFLRLLPGQALNEAEVLRLLARAGLAVQRRAWGPAPTAGGAPSLLLITAPATDAVAAGATERLRACTGAEVRRLRVEDLGEKDIE